MSTSISKRLYLGNLHLTDYKSIEDLTVDFKKDLNIIIGKNGAGKSNLLEAVNESITFNNSSIRRFPFKTMDAGFDTSEGENVRLEIKKIKRATFKADNDEYDGPESSQTLFINDLIVFDNLSSDNSFKGKRFRSISAALRGIDIRYGAPIYIRYSIPDHMNCITDAGQIKIPLEEPDMVDIPDIGISIVYKYFLEFEYMVMANEISPLSINKKYLLDNILADDIFINNLNKFTPIKGFKLNENINIYNDGKQIIIENLKFDFLIGDKWMPWSYLSDGTKRLFYLIAKVTGASGKLILIEEPELGVHPHQFDLLMHFLKEQSQYSQIIMSTHSPAALNHLGQDELDRVLIAYASEKGTQVKRMEPDQRETAIKYMNEVGSLSDYWLMSDLEG